MNKKPIIILAALLFISVSVNFLLIGVGVGSDYKSSHGVFQKDKDLRQKLSSEDKKIIKDIMKIAKPELRKKKSEYIQAKKILTDLISQTKVNQKEIERAVKFEAEKKTELMNLMLDVKIKASKKMSAKGLKTLSMIQGHIISGEKHRKKGKHRKHKEREKLSSEKIKSE